MSQDDTLIFNNKQGANVVNITQPTGASPAPSSAPIPRPLPPLQVPPANTSAPSPVPSTPVVTGPTQPLPTISAFDSQPLNPAMDPAGPGLQDDVTILPVSTPESVSVDPVGLPATNQIGSTDTTATQNAPTPTSTVTSAPEVPANPDFRALAEEIVGQIGTPQANTPVTEPTPAPIQAPETETSLPTDSLTTPASPLPPEPVIPTQTPDPQPQVPAPTPVVVTPTPLHVEEPVQGQAEPQLESDPFLQEVHEQDVKVEQDALETLISSSRIDPELKEHLKIELLKFKEIGNDTVPIGQDINTIAAEVMAPEPATPITNPVQKLPPEPPL